MFARLESLEVRETFLYEICSRVVFDKNRSRKVYVRVLSSKVYKYLKF